MLAAVEEAPAEQHTVAPAHLCCFQGFRVCSLGLTVQAFILGLGVGAAL